MDGWKDKMDSQVAGLANHPQTWGHWRHNRKPKHFRVEARLQCCSLISLFENLSFSLSDREKTKFLLSWGSEFSRIMVWLHNFINWCVIANGMSFGGKTHNGEGSQPGAGLGQKRWPWSGVGRTASPDTGDNDHGGRGPALWRLLSKGFKRIVAVYLSWKLKALEDLPQLIKTQFQ